MSHTIHKELRPSPMNPNYGHGVFYRQIQLDRNDGVVRAALEDGNHAFVLTLSHDDQQVTDLAVESIRYPMSTCPGALAPLRQFIGYPVDTPLATLRGEVPARQNCTHLYDLALLAIAHVRSDTPQKTVRVRVEDEAHGPARTQVWINDQLLIDWHCQGWQIQQPEALAGTSLFTGYTPWANQTFSGLELEAALALQKGYLVAQARRFDLAATYGEPMRDLSEPTRVCYSYQPEVMEQAIVSIDYTRDFTHRPEAVGQFLPE